MNPKPVIHFSNFSFKYTAQKYPTLKNINLTIEEFLDITQPLNDSFQSLLTRALENLDIQESSIGRVMLLGGGVLLPGILDGIKERFGKDRVVLPENPEDVLVRGIGLSFTNSHPESEAREREHIPERNSGWHLVHKDGSVIDIYKEIMIAGRSNGADIPLESKKCSRTHALIRLEGNVLTLFDLRSKNGTYVNQAQIAAHSPQYLKLGDEIRFGDQVFALT